MKKLIFLLGFLLTFGLGQAQMQDPVHWKFSMTDVSKTEKELQFTAKIDDHWHVYGLHIPEDGPNPTSFTFTSVEGAELVGEVTSPSNLITKYDETFGMELNWYEKEVTFVQRIKLTGETFTVKGYLRYMCCDDQSCLPPTSEEFEFTGKGLSAADIAAAAAKTAPINSGSGGRGIYSRAPALMAFTANDVSLATPQATTKTLMRAACKDEISLWTSSVTSTITSSTVLPERRISSAVSTLSANDTWPPLEMAILLAAPIWPFKVPTISNSIFYFPICSVPLRFPSW